MINRLRVILTAITYYYSWTVASCKAKFVSSPLIYCFFPFCSVGGAEKVHLDILKAIMDIKPSIFVRYKVNPWLPVKENNSLFDENIAWLHLFKKYGKVTFLSDYLESSRLSSIKTAWIKGKIIGAMNAKKKSVLFFWNDPFVKSILPLLRPRVKVIDIIHNHKPDDPEDMEYLNMDVVRRIDKRILVSPHLKTFLKKIYSRNNIPSDYIDRTHVILNGVSVASLPALEKFDEKLKVIYVARNAVEKRIYLVCKIANEIQKMNLPIAFTMAGPDPDNWQDEGSDNITWLGLVSDENKIMELYSVHQIFLLTSSTEGMPKTMIEAMAAGCIPLVSAVGAIMDYVKDGFNGYLLPAMPEDELIRKAVTNLKNFCENPILIAEMRINAFETVKKNFDINICEHLYRRIIVPPSA